MRNYNSFAGHNLERLAALSDGIFAVAMTLLVLDLRVPVAQAFHSQEPMWVAGAIPSEGVLWNDLVLLSPRLITYLMSFLTLGIFWLGQQTQLNHFTRSDRNLAWIHLAFLLAVTLMPFSTALLSEFITYRLALILYWLNLLFLGAMLFVSWRYARQSGLLSEEATVDVRAATERRILIYLVLYTFGALLCVINTYASIAFLVLLQLNSVFAPRIPPFNRF